MNKEIKEILEDYKQLAGEITLKLDNTAEYESWLIIQDYVDRFLDYITNLQEQIDALTTLANSYKKDIDKAIKYNYELQEKYCHSALFDNLVASKIYEITEKQLNILQGEDNE